MLFFAVLIYWLDRFEKEPIRLLGLAFFWGASIAAGVAFLVNSLLDGGIFFLTGSASIAELTTGSMVAPIVEETLKGIAVLLVFLFVHNEFDSILDGIVYSAVVALGFAATENTIYIYQYGFIQHGWPGLVEITMIRVFLVGWQHPFYTAFFGIGLAVARLTRSRNLKWMAPLLGWISAIFLHSVHNTLAGFFPGNSGLVLTTSFDWIGWSSMLVFSLFMIKKERRLITRFLLLEKNQGTISELQYQTACSPFSQGIARWKALVSGNLRNTNRFYQLCGEIAHKKNQLDLVGEETGNSLIIDRIRQELGILSTKI